VYNSKIVPFIFSVPMDSSVPLMYIRTDVFTAAGLQPPSTWSELLYVARKVNGTDLNGDKQLDFGLCLSLDEGGPWCAVCCAVLLICMLWPAFAVRDVAVFCCSLLCCAVLC
jgi:hypothetical protein